MNAASGSRFCGNDALLSVSIIVLEHSLGADMDESEPRYLVIGVREYDIIAAEFIMCLFSFLVRTRS